MYQIINEKTGETIAKDLNDAALAKWWKENEGQFFGVRLDGATVVVVDDMQGWRV